jgi:multidrug efflux pump subunit AcrB
VSHHRKAYFPPGEIKDLVVNRFSRCRIFREFAVTLSVAVTISMIVSLTTTPAMCAKFLKPEKGRKDNRLGRASERGFKWLYDGYASSLRWVLQHQPLVLGIT